VRTGTDITIQNLKHSLDYEWRLYLSNNLKHKRRLWASQWTKNNYLVYPAI
jgi:hypothetical protein